MKRFGGDANAHSNRLSNQPVISPSTKHTQRNGEAGRSRCDGQPEPISAAVVGDVQLHVDAISIHDLDGDCLGIRIEKRLVVRLRVAADKNRRGQERGERGTRRHWI